MSNPEKDPVEPTRRADAAHVAQEVREREVIHDRACGVPTGRTWACACNERNGYRTLRPGTPDA